MSTLYLMRHSYAVSADFQTNDDARWLTSRGRSLAMASGIALAANLQETFAKIDCIVCSPLVRAVQTAELVASQLSYYDGEIVSMQCLRSQTSTQYAVESLLELGKKFRVLAVSHEPLVSLMSGQLSDDAASAGFQPSAIRALAGGRLLWRRDP